MNKSDKTHKLTYYLQELADYNVRKQFEKVIFRIHDSYSPYTCGNPRDKSLEVGSTREKIDTIGCPAGNISVNAQYISIDLFHDGNGETITKGHPSYELSHAVSLFYEGLDTKLKNKDTKNNLDLEPYFQDKGKDFAAGYLSKFGSITRYGCDKLSVNLTIAGFIAMIKEKDAYNAALNVWNNS